MRGPSTSLRTGLAVFFVVLAPVVKATAQDADALIDEGIALREQSRDAEALARFEEAHRVSPSPRALAQIALAEQALGRYVAAEAHMREALSGSDRFVDRNRRLLEEALGEIGAHLGSLMMTGGVDGAVVTIDGEARGTLPLDAPLRVIAGTVRVEVSAAGYESFTGEAEVPAAGEISLPIELRAFPGRPPDREPSRAMTSPTTSSEGWMMPVGLAVAGVGVAGIVVASVLLGLREEHAQARLVCTDDQPGCVDHYYAALDLEAAGIATFVASGILVAGGAVLAVLGMQSERAPEVACLPAGLGVACAARF